MGKSRTEQCELDMTPMIDVVFQLIIFFVVTLRMSDDSNKEIILEDGRHGVVITADTMPPTTLVIEVDKKGRISIHNATFNVQQLSNVVRSRVNKFGGDFPILVRADKDAQHQYVRTVMDVCTANGVGKLSFVAVEEHKERKNR